MVRDMLKKKVWALSGNQNQKKVFSQSKLLYRGLYPIKMALEGFFSCNQSCFKWFVVYQKCFQGLCFPLLHKWFRAVRTCASNYGYEGLGHQSDTSGFYILEFQTYCGINVHLRKGQNSQLNLSLCQVCFLPSFFISLFRIGPLLLGWFWFRLFLSF